jgi:hypothetical protein
MKESEMILTNEKLAELEANQQGPCLSLYQETHRCSPDNKQDPIRFRNLVKKLRTVLQEKYPEADQEDLLNPIMALEDDADFWAHTQDGLTVLRRPDQFHVFRLQRPFPEFIAVDGVFYLTPLRRYLQSVDRFQILGLSLDKVNLFEGNRNALDEITGESGFELTRTSILGEEKTEPEKSVSSHGGIGHGSIPTRHGYSDKQNDIDIDTEKFFRAVDKVVFEHYSKASKLPLILACLPEHQNLFRKVSNNPYLLALNLDQNPEFLQLNELRKLAWGLFEPYYTAQLSKLTEDYVAAKSKGLGSEDLEQVTQAAKDGRVEMLLLESGRSVDASGIGPLEVLTEMVEKMGGRVVVIPEQRVPGRSGLAAIFRY